MALALYDLEGRDGRRISPFCWRTKYALAHKGLAAEDRPVGFTDIKSIGKDIGAGITSVPVLDHDGKLVADSWQIALYLDRTFDDTAPIFPNQDALSYAQFVEKWLFSQIFTVLFPAMVKKVHDHLKPQDQAYFRESREKNLGGMTLEQAETRSAQGLGAMNVALGPLRGKIQDTDFLCGNAPGYADYVAASTFMWARAVYPHALFAPGDPAAQWYTRCLDLYGGLGRATPGYDIAA